MRIALYGGSFNPPHLGHLSAVRIVKKVLSPDQLWIIPDYLPPHKELSESAPEAKDRLEMCRIAFSDIEGVEISDMELRRGGRSYTVDTLGEIHQAFPDAELFFVMGSDMLLTFEGWRCFQDILNLCTLVCVPREVDDLPVLQRQARHLRDRYQGRVILIEEPPLVLSSTQVREELSRCSATEYLPKELEKFIREKRFYGTH